MTSKPSTAPLNLVPTPSAANPSEQQRSEQVPTKAKSSISIKEYYAENGSPFSNKDASIIGPVLVELSEKGGVTARDVLDTGRSTQSPLHQYFEWNNEKAADEYRLHQARKIMQSIRITYTKAGDEQEHSARIVQAVRVSAYEDEPRKYHSFETLHGDTLFAAKLLGSAVDDLKAWKRKYEPYIDTWDKFEKTLHGVSNQIRKFEKEVSAVNPDVMTDKAVTELLKWKADHIEALILWVRCKEQIQNIIKAIVEAEAVFAKVNTFAYRKCVTCGNEFESVGAGHRICDNCKPKVSRLS